LGKKSGFLKNPSGVTNRLSHDRTFPRNI